MRGLKMTHTHIHTHTHTQKARLLISNFTELSPAELHIKNTRANLHGRDLIIVKCVSTNQVGKNT